MTATMPATRGAGRLRSWRWVLLCLVAICAVAAVSAYLTAPRPGGQMDPASTNPGGAHALVALLRSHGVDVVVARTVADVEKAMDAQSLLLIAQSQRIADPELLHRLAELPGDRLLVEPTSRARAVLAPQIRISAASTPDSQPNCALREANRAGSVQFGPTDTYRAIGSREIISCYGGALIRYRDGDRTVTLVGSTDFMSNGGLLRAGNAALAMNLAGARARLIWYAPQRVEGHTSSKTTLLGLIPDNVTWMVWQLVLAVFLFALWKGRRMGPLVAEELHVVVRASETVEGRGRLYRSRRARDRAAQALRTATLQRLLPRLGLATPSPDAPVANAVAQRSGSHPDTVWHTLFGPPPATDTDLVHLARALDDIERRINYS
ncbi:DUF4350 domain-containing protein [Mycobacterium shimoidei]|nr:DUF4350 domain-containing protein [Mycobacterium shimoidei]